MIENSYTTLQANEIDHDTCLNSVYHKLRQFRDLNTHYLAQLNERKQKLNNNFTLEMDEHIKTFIEDYGISFHRIPIEGEIATVEYNYQDRLFELEFHKSSPNSYQV